jgi:hypothetical protein
MVSLFRSTACARAIAVAAVTIVLNHFPVQAVAQTAATLKGRITDASGAVVPRARVVLADQGTGVERIADSDAGGQYRFDVLPVGSYRIEVEAPGLRRASLPDLVVEVGQTIVQDFGLEVGDLVDTVNVVAEIPLIERSIALGQIVDRRTIEDLPLNGRKILQLALLVPGSVTPPQSGFLTAPSRAQGSQALNTTGHREDTANFQVNGVTLNDQLNNILLFQPPIDAVQEFRIDTSSPTVEHGRTSGASISIVSRSGTNQWRGGLFEFLRHRSLDARNAFAPETKTEFERHQFGGQAGGPLARNRTFFFAAYEGLRQEQGLPANSVVPSNEERAAVTDPVISRLLPLIPRPTRTDEPGVARFVGAASAPVEVDQWTGDVTHHMASVHRLHGFYAFQRDDRAEPFELGNTLPGFGDVRGGHRQLLTLEYTQIAGNRRVHETRAGFSRIDFEGRAAAPLRPPDFGIDTGHTRASGLPVLNIAGAFNFGGPADVPQGRTDTTAVVSHTMSHGRGAHALKAGGEYRHFTYDASTLDSGTFNFPSVAAFLSGTANAFRVTLGDRAALITQPSLGGFLQDSVRLHPAVTVDLGVRYEWNMTPTEDQDRWVVFDAATASLLRIGVDREEVYRQNHNLEPRLGAAWDPWADGRTLVRATYALTVEQPMVNAVSNLGANPPLGTPLTVTGVVPIGAGFAQARDAGLAPITIDPGYRNSLAHAWNVNVQREIASGTAVMAGALWTTGRHLRLTRNLNQPVNGVRPFPAVSAASPILPGTPLGNIIQIESSGKSRYRSLWASMTRRLSQGFQFNASYTWARSLDYNSLSSPPVVITVQNGYDLEDSWGLSDFDARHRVAVRAVYQLPSGRHALLSSWQVAAVLQSQSGNPVNIVTSSSTLTGIPNTVRPDVTGPIEIIGDVQRWFDPSVFVVVNGFGNLQRNAVVGPRFDNVDVSLSKTITMTWARVLLQADVFNVFNHPNFGQPGRIVGSPNFAVITNTRFPPGDSGSSRQIQLAVRLLF